MKLKNILLAVGLSTFLYGCGGGGVDPMAGDGPDLNAPTTASGFYENSATSIGQAFLQETKDTILFKLNSHELTADAKAILDKQAEFIKANNINSIVVEGHADERGTREYNLGLGEKRATIVKKYLVSKGVAKNKIQVISYGKERPVVELHAESAWSKNRRAVTVVM
ncbi:MAG: peptidoglycan-associated lipoprotein Pal [Alphaproteobacteria bacterium]